MSKNNSGNTGIILVFVVFVVLAVALWQFSSFTPSPEGMTESPPPSPKVLSGGLPQPETIENIAPSSKDHAHQSQMDTPEPQKEMKEMSAPRFDKSAVTKDGTSLPLRAIGDPDAPIQIVEYASLTCSHCADFHKNTLPALKKKYIDTGKVYMIFREFPLNKTAIEASQVLRCMSEDKHYSFMTLLFETQEQWAFTKDPLTKVKQNAKLAGLSDTQIETCLADEALEKALTESLKIGSDAYNVRSTPSFVINNGARLISGNQKVSFFEKIIDDLLSQAN